jgi:hypothetical protein
MSERLLNRTTLRLAPGESATFTGGARAFAEINARFGADIAGFEPGNVVEASYQRGQNPGFSAPRNPVVEDRYSEEVSIVPAGTSKVTMAAPMARSRWG